MRVNPLLCIGGPTASGKTSVGLALINILGDEATLIDSDRIWLDALEKPPGELLRKGENKAAVSGRFYSILTQNTMDALHMGKIPIVLSTFRTQDRRDYFERLAASEHVPFKGIWLMASADVIVKCATQRQVAWKEGRREPGNYSVADAMVEDPVAFQRQISSRWLRVDAEKSIDVVANNILSYAGLGKPAKVFLLPEEKRSEASHLSHPGVL